MAKSRSRSKQQKKADQQAAAKQRADNRAAEKVVQQKIRAAQAKTTAAEQFAAVSRPESGSFRDFFTQITANRCGTIGFVLSLGQLVLHGIWMGMVASLSASGQADQLPPGAWQLYAISGLMIVGMITTAVALFLSLYGTIHGRPKVLAIIGLCLSFFVGATTTLIVLLNAFS